MAFSLTTFAQRDKQQHFGVGFAIGATTSLIIKQPRKAFNTSLLASVGVGLIKEWSDNTRCDNRFDNRDFQATVIGGIVGSATVILIRKIQKRHGKQQKVLF